MKNEIVLAVTQLAAERNLPKEVVFRAVEQALQSTYRKDSFLGKHDFTVTIVPASGDIKFCAQKRVVESVNDHFHEISLDEAHQLKKDAQLGEVISVEIKPPGTGRIIAQTAKQIVIQRLREAEQEFISGEFASREGEILSGVVSRIEARQMVVDLGKAEGILPLVEQVRTEHYRVGQRLRFYLLEVSHTNKGPQLILSRTHPNLVRRLFELEIPEIANGTVEIKGIARDPGSRSKLAVAERQEGVDPVGCCIGLRGVRIQNIVNELQGEKIDVIRWHPDPRVFVANALSPARVSRVELNLEEGSALVIVPDNQLSLAIGREGQNARLAAKLTGWKIDIKSQSLFEQEEAARQAEEEAARRAEEELRREAEEEAVSEPEVPMEEVREEVPAAKSAIRFAEDVLPEITRPSKEKKKEGAKAKKKGKPRRVLLEEEEYEEL